MQPDNEIWSVNRIQHKKQFCLKIYSKRGGETSSRPFSKKSILIVSLDQQSKVFTDYLYCTSKLRAFEIY